MTKRFALAAALAAAFVVVLASIALGHAPLQSSDPADGATIKTPYTLTATFGEEITPNGSSLVVQDSTGAQVATGTVDPNNDMQMTIDLPQLPDGQYTVLWVSVTADDNGILRGTYHFNVSASGSGSAIPASPSPSASNDSSTNSGALVAVGVAVAISVAALVFFLYRNRR